MSKVFLVTGAAYGIGRATAKRLLSQGHVVYGADQFFDEMSNLEEDGLRPIRLDVRDREAVNDCVQNVLSKEGRIDGLVANAGHICLGMLECVSEADYEDQFQVNVFGVARCVNAVLPTLRSAKAGTIVILSSIAGKISAPGMGWYCASKHAVEAYADALRMELKRFGINVVLIEPGFVKTELMRLSLPTLERARVADTNEVYQSDHANFEANCSRDFYRGADPDQVARVIVKALQLTRPKARYRPTFDSKFNLFAKRFFDGRFFDSQVMRRLLRTP